MTRLYVAKRYGDDDVRTVERALRVAALPESWKEYLQGAARQTERVSRRVSRRCPGPSPEQCVTSILATPLIGI